MVLSPRMESHLQERTAGSLEDLLDCFLQRATNRLNLGVGKPVHPHAPAAIRSRGQGNAEAKDQRQLAPGWGPAPALKL
jgi:hypothetical protein